MRRSVACPSLCPSRHSSLRLSLSSTAALFVGGKGRATPSPHAGGWRRPSPTESTKTAIGAVRSFLLARLAAEPGEGNPDRVDYIARDAAIAFETAFMALVLEPSAAEGGSVSSSRFRRFLQNIGLCTLAQADLAM